MFFKRKEEVNSSDEYFKNRDSLTGCTDKAFAIKEFERVKKLEGYGAVLVRLRDADKMSMREGEYLIKETANIILSIFEGNVSRLEFGDFLLLSKNCKGDADRINAFLKALSDEKRRYAVGAEVLCKTGENYTEFMKRLQRAVSAAEMVGGKKAIY